MSSVLTSQGTVMLVDDISIKHAPVAPNGKQHFRMSNLTGNPTPSVSASNLVMDSKSMQVGFVQIRKPVIRTDKK